jgi:hypothetical protein
LGNVIVVFAIFGSGLGIEEIVARDELENLHVTDRALVPQDSFQTPRRCSTQITYHRRHAPYVCACSPFRAEDDFGRSILTGLNVIGEMMAHPACVA